MSDARACLRFTLGKDGFALPLDAVQEIVPVVGITPVPLAPPSIRGLVNIRGHVVTLIDIGHCYGRPLPEARLPEDRLACVLAAPHAHLAFYLHAPIEITGTSTRGFAAAAETMAVPAGSLRGSAPDDGHPVASRAGILHLVSIDAILGRCHGDIIAAYRRAEGTTA